jgi:hypothetical protein
MRAASTPSGILLSAVLLHLVEPLASSGVGVRSDALRGNCERHQLAACLWERGVTVVKGSALRNPDSDCAMSDRSLQMAQVPKGMGLPCRNDVRHYEWRVTPTNLSVE